MSNPIMRNIAALVAGVVTAMLVVMLVEGAGHVIFPPPDGLDITDPADQVQLMEAIPLAAKIAVVAAWFLGAFAGAFVAGKISRKILPPIVVGVAMIAASVATTNMFPHPGWMVVSAIALPVIAVWLAIRLAVPAR